MALPFLLLANSASAAIVFDIDESTFRTSNGTDYEVDARIIVNDVNDPDLTMMTQVSGINFLITFGMPQPDVNFTGIRAPDSNPLFPNASYNSFGAIPNAYVFGSVSSSAPAFDPLLDNKNLLTLQYTVPSGFSGTVDLVVNPMDTVFNSGPATFFVTTIGSQNTLFDSVSGGSHATAVPEPHAWIFSLLACLCVKRRIKKRRL